MKVDNIAGTISGRKGRDVLRETRKSNTEKREK